MAGPTPMETQLTFPVGTVLGAYTIWTMSQPGTRSYLEGA